MATTGKTVLEEILMMMPSVEDRDITAYSIDFQYKGLDVEAVLIFLRTKIQDESKRLVKLIALGLIRGNMLTKILKTMNPTIADEIQQSATTFRIKDTISGSDKAITLTLSRLRIVLPSFAAACLKSEKINRPISVGTLQAYSLESDNVVFGIQVILD